MPNPKDIVDLTDKLGLIEVLRNKIVGNPDVAAAKVVVALEELSQALTIFETELVRFLTISFDTDEEIADARKTLVELESDRLLARISKGKASVRRVENLYGRYLRTWLDAILAREESDLLEELFADFTGDEMDYLDLLSELGQELSETVHKTSLLLNECKLDEAGEIVAELRVQTLPGRRAASGLLRKLFLLEAELITSMGAT